MPPATTDEDRHFLVAFNANTFDFGDAPVSYEGGNSAGEYV